jgi:C1A family cysteine protease
MKAVVATTLATAAAATDLSLTWSDCGTSAHAKITDFKPSSLTLGQQTSMTGTGDLDEQVTSAKFDMTMTGAIGTLVHCTGDASQSKTCSLPLNTGSLIWDGLTFPIAAGSVPINVDINLAATVPTSLQTTTTTAKATDQNGEELFCIQIKSAPAMSDTPESYYQDLWKQFKENYTEHPSNANDAQTRYDKFKANVKIIDEHNAKQLSYTLGVNEFADLSWDEFASAHLGYNAGSRFGSSAKVPFPEIADVADSIDWVSKGAVTPVKNQQQCGSCWAFSTTGALEGAYFVASGKLESLSEEDLVQCDHNGDQGCSGGLMDNAFSWVSQNGICSEKSYPYTSGSGRTGTCQKGCSPVVTITGHTDVPARNEDALKAAVSKHPVSVAIEADKSAFQLYRSGVLDSSSCGTNLDHGVLVVGYGTDGKDYWKVKNSWGASWGEEGYIRMVRNKNMCGISQQASYPTGAKAASGSSVVV